ncbi:3-keto-disaccharide hydrolase [Planctomicrobium sp. SH527]|uniref:3-keto-disaccharide hydrolase n=1 Tax=Planctomicrobium sp. SH527 TaxID=3448123 RepID=UPI003F5B6221
MILNEQSGRLHFTTFRVLLGIVLFFELSFPEFASAEARGQSRFASVDLLSAESPFPGKTWTYFSGRQNSKISDTWRIATDQETGKPLLICSGEPHGYLQTVKTYKDFELEVEWRYPVDKNGNSGILLFINGEPQIWPASVQVQLYQPEAGSTFASTGMHLSNEIRKVPQFAKPVNHWNRCQVVCKAGTISVSINGQKVGEVAGSQPSSGAVGLQSEGAEVHFRNFIIRELIEEEPVPATPEVEPAASLIEK